MQVTMPNGDRHVYMFNLESCENEQRRSIGSRIFEQPRVPSGWKRW